MRAYLWTILWALIILALCLMPGPQLPKWEWFDIFNLDKLVHGILFFILAVFCAQAMRHGGSPVRYILWACILSVLYGVGTELLQGLEVLGRRTDVNDMMANAIGAIAAGGFANWRDKKGLPIMPLAFLR